MIASSLCNALHESVWKNAPFCPNKSGEHSPQSYHSTAMTTPAYNTNLSRRQLLGLYKQLLEHGKVFPSIKRAAIVEDIRCGETTTDVTGCEAPYQREKKAMQRPCCPSRCYCSPQCLRR